MLNGFEPIRARVVSCLFYKKIYRTWPIELSAQDFIFCILSRRLPFGVFQDLFWRLKLKHPDKVIVNCPDVMFNTFVREIPDPKYLALTQKWRVKKWVESDGRVRWYGCRRGYSHTSSKRCGDKKGLGVPPCDLENLADAIKFTMKACEDVGIYCELHEGSSLGKLIYYSLSANFRFEVIRSFPKFRRNFARTKHD